MAAGTPDRAALLAAYDSQLRGEADLSGPVDRRLGPLWLSVVNPRRGFLTYASLEGVGDGLDELIEAAIAYFRDETAVATFEWKTRGHDLPLELTERLAAHGLAPEEVESVMIGPVGGVIAAASALPTGVAVRRVAVDDLATFVRAHEMQAHVFGSRVGTAEQSMARCAASGGRRSLWVAEAAAEGRRGEPWGAVVCVGILDVVPGTEFAGIWGGSVLARWRGQGIYRALTAERARAAAGMGARYLQSDSTEFSRPILERARLTRVTTTTPWIWTRATGR